MNGRKAKARRLTAKNDGPQVKASGMLKKVTAPNDEKTIIKEVPANAEGVVVGKAIIYDDGSIDIIFDDNADPEAVAKIKELEAEMGFGYTAETE